MSIARKPWWQQATALVTVSAGGVITGFNFVPGAATLTTPASVPLHQLALEQAAQPDTAGKATTSDAQLRAAIVNVARYYRRLAQTKTPAQMEALIWGEVSSDGADHGPTCAAFASLTLELAAQTTGLRSWVTGGTSYPWPLPTWADVRVDTSPASPQITSVVADAQAHGRWHPLGDGYVPQPGDWVAYDGHVAVVVTYAARGPRHHRRRLPPRPHRQRPLLFRDLRGPGHRRLRGQWQPPARDGRHVRPGRQDRAADRQHGPGQRQGCSREDEGEGVRQAGHRRGPRPARRGRARGDGRHSRRWPRRRERRHGRASDGDSARSPRHWPAPRPARRAYRAAAQVAHVRSGQRKARACQAIPVGHAGPAASPSSASSSPKQYAAPGTRNQQAFISLVAPGAVAAQQRFGVPASVTIAQAIEESAWGQSSLAARYHNLFGIKGTGPAGSVTLPTQEYENGSWVTINAQFAVYYNDAESIAGHAELLATSGYYGRAMADRAYPDAFANSLTGVYATDPDYGANLIALMKLYNLYQYDTTPTATPPATPAPAPSQSSAAASASIPGVISPGKLAPAATDPARPAPGHTTNVVTTAYIAPAPAAGRRALRVAARYQAELPQSVTTALFATAKGPLGRGEHLYRDVAATTDGSWKLLAAADWMQCKADPRYSPVQGEKLGTVNADGTSYLTKTAALAQCAADLIELSAAVYGIDLTARRPLSVRELAAAFAAFRWGALLKRHGVSPMEFPYSVAGLTATHQKMHWPPITDSGAPDRPGSRFRQPFGAVPVVLSLGYPATV